LAEKRAKAKTICLLDELEEENEAERVRNGGLSDAELAGFSQAIVEYNNATDDSGKPIYCAFDPNNPMDPSVPRFNVADLVASDAKVPE
jgi:hypothetical protein